MKNINENIWILGVGLNIIGSIIINLGNNTVQYAYKKKYINTDLESHSTSSIELNLYMFKKYWYLGYFLFAIGNLINFSSLSITSQSLLSSVTNSVQIFTNLIFHKYILGNPLTKHIFPGTLLMIGGSVLAVIFSNRTSTIFTVEELQNLYTQLEYIVLICVEFFLIICFSILYWCIKNKSNTGYVLYLKPLSYITVSVLIGTQSVIFAKSGAELTTLTISGENQLYYYFTYIIFFSWLCVVIFWIFRLNNILKLFNDQYIIPIVQSLWTMLSIVSSGIYFKEFVDFSILQYFMFFLGNFITIFGIFVMINEEIIEEDCDIETVVSLNLPIINPPHL